MGALPSDRDGTARAVRWIGRAASSLRRALVGETFVPPPELLDRFPALALAHWRRGGLPLRIGGWCLGQSTVAGITLGETVFLARGVNASPRLMLHEVEHVRQFQRDKVFPARYLWESVRRGYAGNRYEAEADQFAEEVLWSDTPRRPS